MDPKTQAQAINAVDQLITNLETLLADDPALPRVVAAIESAVAYLLSADAEDPPDPYHFRDRQGGIILTKTFRSHAERDRWLLARKLTTPADVAARVEERQTKHAERATTTEPRRR